MTFIILLGFAVVLGILFLGIFNMVRKNNDEAGARRFQNLMRWRVVAQATVLLLLVLAAVISV